MAKKVIDNLKTQALKALADEETAKSERGRNKKRVLSKQALEKNEDIKTRYIAYLEAVKIFKAARVDLVEARYELQKILNPYLWENGRISKNGYWDFKIDKDGNMEYKNSAKNFIHKKADELIGKDAAQFDDGIFDEPDDDMEDEPQGTSNGTSNGTVPRLEYHASIVLKGFRDITGKGRAQRRLEYFRDKVHEDDKVDFFSMINEQEKKELYDGRNAMEDEYIKDMLEEEYNKTAA